MMFEIIAGMLVVIIGLILFLKMAGGTDGDIRAPWPKGSDSRFLWKFGPFEIIASKTKDFIVEKLQLPFACRVKKAFVTAQDINVTNAITLNIVDDSATPVEIVTDHTLAAITGGAGSYVEMTVASPNTTLKAGALLEMSYGSGASDTAESVTVILELEPVY